MLFPGLRLAGDTGNQPPDPAPQAPTATVNASQREPATWLPQLDSDLVYGSAI